MDEIVHCITTIELGGAEKQLLILAKLQVAAGKKITILYLKGKPALKKDFISAGANVEDFLDKKIFFYQVILINKYLKNKKVILHAHLPRAELLSAFIFRNKKFVVTRHNSEKFFPHAPKFLSSFLSRIVTNRAQGCVAISNAVQKHLIDFNEIKDVTKIQVIYYGYDEKMNSVKTDSINKIGKSSLYIGTIGRLVEQKNQQLLIRAFAHFSKLVPESKLVIVGDGNLKSELLKLSFQLEIQNKIEWIGKTKNIKSIIESMDIFILCSNYEGFGLVLLEAMQLRVPIIAANNSAIPEVLGFDYPGLFRTSDLESLIKVLNKFYYSRTKLNLNEIYRNNLSKFNPQKMERNLDNFYKSLNFYN